MLSQDVLYTNPSVLKYMPVSYIRMYLDIYFVLDYLFNKGQEIKIYTVILVPQLLYL